MWSGRNKSLIPLTAELAHSKSAIHTCPLMVVARPLSTCVPRCSTTLVVGHFLVTSRSTLKCFLVSSKPACVGGLNHTHVYVRMYTGVQHQHRDYNKDLITTMMSSS